MHNSEEGMSWKCTTHLGFSYIQPVSFLFLPFHDTDAFHPVNLLSGHHWENSGRTGRILVEMISSRSDNNIRWQDCWGGWFRLIGSTEEDHRGRSRGETLMAQLTLSDISNCQTAFLSPANGFSHQQKKGSHVKKKTFQLQPRELQCRTHMYIHTSINTHTHTRTSTHGLGQSPKADFSDNQSGE